MSTRPRRHAIRAVLLAGLVVVAVGWLAPRWAVDPDPAGRLSVDEDADTRHDLGPFTVEVDAGADRVGITRSGGEHQSGGADRRTVLATRPGQALLTAAVGEAQVTGRVGHIEVDDHVRRRVRHQTVEAVQVDDEQVVLAGSLHGSWAQIGDGGPVPWRVTLSLLDDDRVRLSAEVDDPEVNRLYLTWAVDDDERLFGGGVQFSELDLRGRRLPVVAGEQGIGRGRQPLTWAVDLAAGAGGDWHSTYAPVPHVLTTALRSVALEQTAFSAIDARRSGRVTMELHDDRLDAQLAAADEPADLVRAHTRLSGRMRPLPDWVHDGAIIGLQGGSDVVRERLAAIREVGTPVSAVWLQDWVGQRPTDFGARLWWNWQVDRDRYPDWEELVAELEADGIRVLTYANPFLGVDAARDAHDRDLFAEAADAGHLVAHPDGDVYAQDQRDFAAALVDLSDDDAAEWLTGVLAEEVAGAGASGWMADFGEGLPVDAALASGEDAAKVRNAYPEWWARANRQALERAGLADDGLVFHRAGFTRAPGSATLFWLGDQTVTWDEHDGIKTVVTGLLSSGFSGFALTHSDTGGYTAVTDFPFTHTRSPELLARWAELNAFTAVLRTHEGNRPDANHQIDDSPGSLRHFARMAVVHRAWADLRRELVAESAETGLPVVRHPWLVFPDDPAMAAVRRQFMVGEDLMVAPVLDEGRRVVDVRLPPGEWVHLWTGDVHDAGDSGRRVLIRAPLGEPPVLYPAGSGVGGELRARLVAAGLADG